MTDARDLEASLAEMDRRLRELQRELAEVTGPEPAAPRPVPAPPPPQPAPDPAAVIEEAAARVAELGRRIDELGRLRADLDRTTEALREQSRAVTSASQRGPEANGVVVNAGPFPDIATLGAFEHALARLDGVQDAWVRSFEGNRAIVEVRLARPLDVATALRGALPFAFDVVAVGRGELTLTLRQPES